MAEGLAVALDIYEDLEKRRAKYLQNFFNYD
jgi:hypothetical protein